jgi:hypothetical protein
MIVVKLSALFFFALLIAIALIVIGRLSKLWSLEQAFGVRPSYDRRFRDPCDHGVDLSVLEIPARVISRSARSFIIIETMPCRSEPTAFVFKV